MNEIMYFPALVALLFFTAIVSSIITTSLPHMGKWFTALKSAIKRRFTRKPKANVYCDDLSKRIDDLEEQINNVSKSRYNREKNRDAKVKKIVIEYLKQLKNG